MSIRVPLVAAVCVVCPAGALAMDDIASTKHNLSTSGRGDYHLVSAPDGDSDKDQICVFCHTPHSGDMDVGVVLWNRTVNEGAYEMYDSASLDMRIASQPQATSLACLSCHDGSLAFDALRNGPGPGDYDEDAPSRGWRFQDGADQLREESAAYLDVNLSNDHPVSVTYDSNDDTAFHSPASVRSEGLKFFTAPSGSDYDQVECASCHNPHSANYTPFLRADNERSRLCLTCHIK